LRIEDAPETKYRLVASSASELPPKIEPTPV